MNFSHLYRSKKPYFEEKEIPPFNELILSWNGLRPKKGKWTFWIGIQNEWLKYAEWGADFQKTFQSIGAFAKTYQDVCTTNGLCNHFTIKVEGEDLSTLHELIVCASNLDAYKLITPPDLPPVMLKNVPTQSQLVLNHPRHKELCSPTATTTAMRYLYKKKFDPVAFADLSHDETFNIHGNWVLNVAESYNQTKHPCRVERLKDFTRLHEELMKGFACVVSVKGYLKGAPKTYDMGHLLCVIGFDGKRVHCIDSAFPDNESTLVSYELSDFLNSWALRYHLAYIFSG
jgi:hypothetical protein